MAEGTLTHPAEAEAAKSGLFLIKPPVTSSQPRGNIGCFGYGAGLAMSTMDAVVAAGGSARPSFSSRINSKHNSDKMASLIAARQLP